MEIKQCCADFYENDAVKLIFGRSLHPGGLDLTKELVEKLGISKNSRVLDIACGTGTSAIFLAKNFGCEVTGIDLAENIDFENESFDFVIAECSFCLFPDKKEASKEMHRILKKGGKLGMSDVIIRGELPEKMKNVLYKFICIEDARSENEYKNILESSGFRNFYFEDKKNEVKDLLEGIRKKIFIFEIAKGLKKVNLEIDLDGVKENIKEIKDCVDKNLISYSLMIAEKNSA